MAVRGRLIAENIKSDIDKLITNIVVARDLSFGHRSKATTVNKLPTIKRNKCSFKKFNCCRLDFRHGSHKLN